MLDNELWYVNKEGFGYIQYNNHIKTKIKGEIIEFDFDKIYNEYELSNIL